MFLGESVLKMLCSALVCETFRSQSINAILLQTTILLFHVFRNQIQARPLNVNDMVRCILLLRQKSWTLSAAMFARRRISRF